MNIKTWLYPSPDLCLTINIDVANTIAKSFRQSIQSELESSNLLGSPGTVTPFYCY